MIMVSMMKVGKWQESRLERQEGAGSRRAKEPESKSRTTKGF